MGEFLDYYNENKPGAFRGAAAFQRTVQNPKAKKWLLTQDAYTLHKPVRRQFPRRKIIVAGPKQQFQADLIDFSRLQKYNDGFKFILVVIDVFSKYAYVECIKNKTSKSVIAAFSKILKRSGHFSTLQTDLGTEFTNKAFQSWLKQHNIHFFTTHNHEIKASIAERFIRTIKEKLWRYFTHENKRKYTHVIQKLVHAYNHTFHRSIQRSPAEVNPSNQELVWLTLYGNLHPKTPKLKVGDRVRISMMRRRFEKSYYQGWTEEEFEIAETFTDDPPYYKVKDLKGTVLEGTFYEQEVQKVVKNNNIYKIESILKKRKRKKHQEYFVKWLGYPDSFNSWIRERDLVHYA